MDHLYLYNSINYSIKKPNKNNSYIIQYVIYYGCPKGAASKYASYFACVLYSISFNPILFPNALAYIKKYNLYKNYFK